MAENRPKIGIAKKREKTAYFLADSRFFCHGTVRKPSIADTAVPQVAAVYFEVMVFGMG